MRRISRLLRARHQERVHRGSINLSSLYIHWDIQQYRTWATLPGDIYSFLQAGKQLVDMCDLVGVLGNAADQRYAVQLLETLLAYVSVAFEFVGIDLTGQEQAGVAIKPAIGDAGDEVSSAGTTCTQRDAEYFMVRRASNCRCGERCPLFMVNRDQLGLAQLIDAVNQVSDHPADQLVAIQNLVLSKNQRYCIRCFHRLETNPKELFQLLTHKIEVLLAQRWLHAEPERLVHGAVSVRQFAHHAVLQVLEVRLARQVAGK